MPIWICRACGVEHADTEQPPPGDCVICADERQYVPAGGQTWTTHAALADEAHDLVVEELEAGVHRFRRTPTFAIGQWSHLVATEAGNLLFDPPNSLDDELLDTLVGLGGVAVIAASHPHMYGCQVSLSHAFGGIPVLVHSADRAWVRRPDEVLRDISDTTEILPGVRLITVGGHFPGMMVAHHAGTADGKGVLLTGDAIIPVADRGWVTFLRSIPNQIPLSPRIVRQVVDRCGQYDFDRLYALAGGVLDTEAKTAVARSAERYIAWARGDHDDLC